MASDIPRTWTIRALGCAVAVCWMSAAGCDRRESASQDAAISRQSKPAGTSAADVVLKLQSAYARRDYAAIAPLIVPARRAATIELLAAADEVLQANRRLRQVAEAAYRGPVSETWSIGEMENNLGPFSAKVTLIGQELRGDGAVVTLQEGDHVPLFKARFVHSPGGWLYDAEPFPAAMVGELRRLATTLDDVAEEVRKGADVHFYLDSFFATVAPQMCRVLTATDPIQRTAQAASDPEPEHP